MPSSLVETVGAANANTYATVADMDTYCDDRLNATAWTQGGSDDGTRALIQAARELENILWKGTRVDSTQALSWPRDEVVNPDLPWASQEPQDSYYYSTTEIPDRIKNAQMELALMMLEAGTTDITVRDPALDVKRKKTDVLETEWFSGAESERATGLDRYPYIINQLAPLMEDSRGAMTVARA
jgi:hypothetical protein